MFGIYWDEPWVVLLLVITMAFAIFAQNKVSRTYKKYSKVSNMRGLTGQTVAKKILRNYGVNNVRVESIRGHLNDHFDSRTKVIRLSEGVFNSTSVAAIGIAAHEVGHAIQYARGYAPIKIRMAIIPVTQFGSKMAFPIILLGAIFSAASIVNIGILLFSLMTIFQLITLPVEFNASARAIRALEKDEILLPEELEMAKRTLDAAALTYIAALATAVAQLIRMIARFGGTDD